MRYLLTTLSLALLLAGCGKEPQESSESRASAPVGAESSSVAAEHKGTCVQDEGIDQLPADVCLVTHYRFVGQRSYKDSQARDRRRVTFRSGGDTGAVARDVSNAFAAAGYYVRPRMETNDGSIQIPMTKKDRATTYLVVKQVASSTDRDESVEFFVDFLAGAANSPGSN